MKKSLLIILFLLGGFYAKSQSCVGSAGQVKWSYWSGFTSTPDTNALFALEFYPETPDGYQMLPTLATPYNFNEYYAGLVRGFIMVPTTTTYTFNLTGDDRVYFYLSTNQSPLNKSKKAEVPNYTGTTEHTKYAQQTSSQITLIGGQYYYFEIVNLEGGYTDFANLYWKTNTDPNWRIVDFNYIYEYTCGTSCAPRGTACNDGNNATTNDQQDGFCNCVGTTPTVNTCIGPKGTLQAYYYDNITGSYVENDLLNAPKFPLVPDRMEDLKGMYGPLKQSFKDTYGTLIQGYLTVPVTGLYEFNLTGDNQTFFFLSKNDSIEYKQNHQLFVFSGVGEYEFNNSIMQKSGPVLMEKGKYYYFEFRHKENTYRDHFHLFWKTPFYPQKTWKKIPDFYIFDYKCEVSCIAQNTLCDDGNPFTNNDKIDGNCNCVGTPCSGPNCDDLGARYQMYDDCSPTDNLNPLEEASWTSCATSPNPNPARSGSQHWIKYDFNDIYKFKEARVWNYNVAGQTAKGFRQVVVDYSVDGTTWTPLGGVYNWPQAPGLVDYSGFVGPNFNDSKAKYILISAINNHGDASCSGFSKVTFEAALCNPLDTPCDDGDPLTSYDKFDANCNCKGVDINCGSDTLALGKISLTDPLFAARKRIESNSLVPNTQNISFTAGNSIVLLPGFEVKNSAVFSAEIASCIQQQFAANEALGQKQIQEQNAMKGLSVDDEETVNTKKVIFRLNEPGDVLLQLKSEKGTVIVTLVEGFQENLGTQTKLIPTQKLKKGRYEIVLKINKNVISEYFEVP